MLQVCRNIKRIRKSKGLTKTKICKLLDITPSTYDSWERNTEPKATILFKIAEILEVDPFYLAGVEKSKDIGNQNTNSRQSEQTLQKISELLAEAQDELQEYLSKMGNKNITSNYSDRDM